MSGQDTVVDEVSSRKGILHIRDGQFEEALFQEIRPLLHPGDTLLLSGMITSRNGWVETPYIETPVSIDEYVSLASRRMVRGAELFFLPGVSQQQPADVIRGEELQIFGACEGNADALVILPGTHSKWVTVSGGCITDFQTTMTGEVYDLLLNQSLVGRVAEGEAYIKGSFQAGLLVGSDASIGSGTVLAKAFTTRANFLLGKLSAQGVSSYLSGLLIGSEVRASTNLLQERERPVILIGNEELCDRYALALKFVGCEKCTIIDDASLRGFMNVAESLRNNDEL